MDIEALIKNLQALSDTLKSTAIREGESLNDFKNSVERFEAVFSDLVVVSKSDVQISSSETKEILKDNKKYAKIRLILNIIRHFLVLILVIRFTNV